MHKIVPQSLKAANQPHSITTVNVRLVSPPSPLRLHLSMHCLSTLASLALLGDGVSSQPIRSVLAAQLESAGKHSAEFSYIVIRVG